MTRNKADFVNNVAKSNKNNNRLRQFGESLSCSQEVKKVAPNSQMEAIGEQAAAFISLVGAQGMYVQFLNQFVDYVCQQHH